MVIEICCVKLQYDEPYESKSNDDVCNNENYK